MSITRFAQNDLARISYEVTGPDPGPVLVLLHATLADRGSLGPLRDVFETRMRVIMPDARGHGGSSALKDRVFDVTDMANDLYAVLEAEGLVTSGAPPVHVAGYGQGAITALELARRRPDLAATLTLIEPDAVSLLEGDADAEVAMAREAARSANTAAADAAYKGLADRALSLYLDRRWGEVWAQRLPRPRLAAVRRNVLALSASLDALDRYRVLPEQLGEIMVPTRIVVAAASPLAERTVAARLGEWLPRGRTVYVADLPGGAPLTGAGEAAINVLQDWIGEQAV